jgi:hypothetical protein
VERKHNRPLKDVSLFVQQLLAHELQSISGRILFVSNRFLDGVITPSPNTLEEILEASFAAALGGDESSFPNAEHRHTAVDRKLFAPSSLEG